VLHNVFEAIVERGDILFFIVERDDDGIFWHLIMIPPSKIGCAKASPGNGNEIVKGLPPDSIAG
jgi:hypothetical protein